MKQLFILCNIFITLWEMKGVGSVQVGMCCGVGVEVIGQPWVSVAYFLPCLRQDPFVIHHCRDQASWPMSFQGFSRRSSHLATGALGLDMCTTLPSFIYISGIPPMVLRHAWQAFYPLSHHPTLQSKCS